MEQPPPVHPRARQHRPVHAPGIAAVPPASVPLGFLIAAGIGLTEFGFAAWFAADRIVASPTHQGAVAAVHIGMLAFLTTAVLGAAHQFAPVVGRRPVRSVPAARVTLVGIVVTGQLLPTGFAHGPEAFVLAGGITGAATVLLAAWNLSAPLSAGDGGLPIVGLRLAVGFLIATVGFGVVYAANRQTGWFPLFPNRVLAHAHLGLLGWLGIAYVSVAEKLWPMFLLAHRPRARSGRSAVALLAAGVPVTALGLLLGAPYLAWPGGVIVAAGLGCHVGSLSGAVRHRRRPLELLHAFLFSSTALLVAAAVLAAIAAVAPVDPATRARLVAAEVAALTGWLTLAIVGHAHKIVPFIAYGVLRDRGITTNKEGRQLLFADLFDQRLARVTFACASTAFPILIAGILTRSSTTGACGAALIAATGALTTFNLARGFSRASATPQGSIPTPELGGAPA